MVDKPGNKDRGQIRVPPDLKKKIGITSKTRGIYEYQLIEEMWAAWSGSPEGGPLRDLSSRERKILEGVLRFLRDPSTNDDWGKISKEVLEGIARRYPPSKHG